MNKVTLISNVWNEEYLLPWWLKWNKRIFDHGIIMDYESTDRSVEIIKDICPTWEIVTPTNPHNFSIPNNEENFKQIEKRVDGWKCVLNTTEFLFHYNLKEYIENFEKKYPTKVGFTLCPISMIDPNPDYNEKLGYSNSLISQKFHGFFEEDFRHNAIYREEDNFNAPLIPESYPFRGSRILHKAEWGKYTTGRHGTNLDDIFYNSDDIFMLWYGFGPRTNEIVSRKAAIRDRVPFDDQKEMRSFHHLWTKDAIVGWMDYLVEVCNNSHTIKQNNHFIDLIKNKELKDIFNKIEHNYQ
jgi:hypothetical protein